MPLPAMHEPDFIGLCVPIEVAHALSWARDAERDIAVAQQDAARLPGSLPLGSCAVLKARCRNRAEGGIFRCQLA